jgi:hypothetical protein
MADEAFVGTPAKGIGTLTGVTGGCQTRDGPSSPNLLHSQMGYILHSQMGYILYCWGVVWGWYGGGRIYTTLLQPPCVFLFAHTQQDQERATNVAHQGLAC